MNRHDVFGWVAEQRLPSVATGDFHRPEHLATWKTLLPCAKDRARPRRLPPLAGARPTSRASSRRPSPRSPRSHDTPSSVAGRMSAMRVGIVDVGSNTVRLLVAEHAGGGSRASRRSARSSRSAPRSSATASSARARSRRPRRPSPATSSWRAAPGPSTSRCSSRRPAARRRTAPSSASRSCARPARSVRVLTAEDEGRLAYSGALIQRRSARGRRRRVRRRRRLQPDRDRHRADVAELGALGRHRLAAADAALRHQRPALGRRAAVGTRRRGGRPRQARAAAAAHRARHGRHRARRSPGSWAGRSTRRRSRRRWRSWAASRPRRSPAATASCAGAPRLLPAGTVVLLRRRRSSGCRSRSRAAGCARARRWSCSSAPPRVA